MRQFTLTPCPSPLRCRVFAGCATRPPHTQLPFPLLSGVEFLADGVLMRCWSSPPCPSLPERERGVCGRRCDTPVPLTCRNARF